jgi:hypothetical protein
MNIAKNHRAKLFSELLHELEHRLIGSRERPEIPLPTNCRVVHDDRKHELISHLFIPVQWM